MAAARQDLALPTARALLGVVDLPSRDVGTSAAGTAAGVAAAGSTSEEGHFTDVERRHVLAWVLLLCRFLSPHQLARIGTTSSTLLRPTTHITLTHIFSLSSLLFYNHLPRPRLPTIPQ